jgi:CspA family cold shock protein
MNSKYGFITNDEDNKDVFVHLNDLKRSNINELIKGDRVRFELKTKDSKILASNIELI